MPKITLAPASTPHSISMTLIPLPMASSRSIKTSSRFSIPFSCSVMNSAIALSLSSSEKGCTSQSSPVTASFLVCICEKRCVSFSSISSKSSICSRTSPSSACRNILASRCGVSPLDGYMEYLSFTSPIATDARTDLPIPVSTSGLNACFFFFFFDIYCRPPNKLLFPCGTSA